MDYKSTNKSPFIKMVTEESGTTTTFIKKSVKKHCFVVKKNVILYQKLVKKNAIKWRESYINH